MKRALLAAIALVGTIGAANAAGPATPTADGAEIDWSGFYAGVNGGYGGGKYSYDDGSETLNLAGLFLGGQIGYNFVLVNNLVLGVQLDGDWSNQSGNYSLPAFGYSDTFRTDWNGSATARLGVALGNIMPYVLGGATIAHGSESYAGYIPNTSIGTASGTQIGWTAGLGAEARVADNIGAFVEGRYTSYRSANFPGTWNNGTWTLTGTEADWSVRTGVNFHF